MHAILNHMVQYQSNLDRVFHALSDATRRDILSRLDQGNLGVTALCEDYNMSLPAVAKHVRVLEQAGLVRTAKQGRVRTVVAQPRNLKIAADWVAHYERYWTDALARFAAFVEEGP
jgi:DNA-binding transcriptional ArsR family regulator